MPIVNMFFKSNKIPVKTEEPRLNQDLAIITQMNQEFATSLDLTDTLQNAFSKNLDQYMDKQFVIVQD